jgi:hypothetical protein
LPVVEQGEDQPKTQMVAVVVARVDSALLREQAEVELLPNLNYPSILDLPIPLPLVLAVQGQVEAMETMDLIQY